MAYGRRSSTAASLITDAFTLNPLPWPVLTIFAVIFIFLGVSFYSSYQSAVEDLEDQTGWLLLAVPLLLLLLLRWLSTMKNPEGLFRWVDRRRRRGHWQPPEGSSPWGVAALIVVLLVLLQFQSSFHESWFL